MYFEKREPALKRLYADFTDWLVLKFDEWDPQQLVVIESNPGREYEPEVRRIVPLLQRAESSDQLAECIHSIFEEMFNADIAGSIEVYRPFARQILAEWQKRWSALPSA
jgi:hypothetical protein